MKFREEENKDMGKDQSADRSPSEFSWPNMLYKYMLFQTVPIICSGVQREMTTTLTQVGWWGTEKITLLHNLENAPSNICRKYHD